MGLAAPLISLSKEPVSAVVVLLVSPDPLAVAGLKHSLKSRGFVVRTSRQWSTLLKAIDKNRPAVIILDGVGETLPALEGLRLTKKIYSSLLVCILASPEVREKLDEAGGGELLNRRLSDQELAARVQLYLQRHQVVQENHRLQAKVWQTEGYLAHILDQVGEAIITTDLHGVVKSVNFAAQGMLHLQAAEVIGQNLAGIRLEGEGYVNLNQIVMRTLGHNVCEGRFLLAAGHSLPLPVYIRGTTYTEDLKQQGTILLLRDLTQEEELELRLAESERLAALGQIAAGMAHEIRNPLMGIGGLLRRLNKMVPEDHPGKAYLPHILDNIKRMENMVREIDEYLSFIRSDMYHEEKLNVSEVVLAALTRLGEAHALGDITMSLDLAPDLVVRGNFESLTELFFQLAHNACEAMAEGGELRLCGRREDHLALVTITDSGQGITLENLKQIYQPFFTTKSTGAGLGLTKAYMIAERHRGRIEAQSRPGQGTTFLVHLPLASSTETGSLSC